MPTTQGNTTVGHLSGSGRLRERTPFGLLTISGATGEVVRVSTNDLYQKVDIGPQGIYVQALGGNVQIDATLVSPDLAKNPAQDVGGHWIADTTLTPGTITKLVNAATALRITFTTAATLQILGT